MAAAIKDAISFIVKPLMSGLKNGCPNLDTKHNNALEPVWLTSRCIFFLQIADLMFFYRFFVVVINSCILYKT